MINNVVLVGRITKDLELRYTSSNKEVTSFTLAINRAFKGQDGQTQADFISCITFGKIAENLCRYCGKGSLIGVEGRIQTRNFQGKDGNTVYLTEVIADRVQFIDNKNQSQQGQQTHFNNNYNQSFNNGYNQQGNYNQAYNKQNNGFKGQKPDAMDYITQNNTNNQYGMFNDLGNGFSSDEFNFDNVPNPFQEDQ